MYFHEDERRESQIVKILKQSAQYKYNIFIRSCEWRENCASFKPFDSVVVEATKLSL